MRWEISPWQHWGDVGAGIQLDGDLGDWSSVSYKSQTPFRPCDKIGGELCAAPFVEYDVCVACDASAAPPGTVRRTTPQPSPSPGPRAHFGLP